MDLIAPAGRIKCPRGWAAMGGGLNSPGLFPLFDQFFGRRFESQVFNPSATETRTHILTVRCVTGKRGLRVATAD